MRAEYCRYRLKFLSPATTSRETMTVKDTYFIRVLDEEEPERFGIGECALFRGLSADDRPDYESKLAELCRNIGDGVSTDLSGWSSINFGLETALADLRNGGCRRPFPSEWSEGQSEIEINGLVWMGSVDEMRQRVALKIAQGFRCVKFKIGGQDFDAEFSLLDRIRQAHSPEELEIRLDANGAFGLDEASEKLRRLAVLDIHSIEQPIRQGHPEHMAELCKYSPIPIALDEELIGIESREERHRLLQCIAPRYIVLKPSLCGGFSGAEEWISLAGDSGIGWWATSALESNVGLNAIAQWVSGKSVSMPQGLGTGALYSNNIESPLFQTGSVLRYDPAKQWVVPELPWI